MRIVSDNTLRANYLAYLVRHHCLKNHPSPLGHGWELLGGRCRPVRHTRPALPVNIPASGQAEDSEDDESESEGDRDSSESEGPEYSVAENSDSDWSNLFDTKLQNIIVLPIDDVYMRNSNANIIKYKSMFSVFLYIVYMF